MGLAGDLFPKLSSIKERKRDRLSKKEDEVGRCHFVCRVGFPSLEGAENGGWKGGGKGVEWVESFLPPQFELMNYIRARLKHHL